MKTALLIFVGVAYSRPTTAGLTYAIASGAVACGLGYIIWYGVLPKLSRTIAAVVQLTVPAIAALGGVVFIAMAGIIGGVSITLMATERRNRGRR